MISSLLKKIFRRLSEGIFPSPSIAPKESYPSLIGDLTGNDLILCNFCGTIFCRVGPDHAEFLACPHCDSIARERVVYQAVLHKLSKQSCSTMLFFRNAIQMHKLRCLECSPRFNTNRRKIYDATLYSYMTSDYDMSAHRADIRMDLTNRQDVEPFTEAFDIIICAHVLEHIEDYRTALRNLAVMVTPGGFMVLQVPLQERQYTPVTWDEFHGDQTKVFHRFGFDIMTEIEQHFPRVTPVVGLLDFPITSQKINPDKYESLKPYHQQTIIFGEQARHFLGLGMPDLCDAFLAIK